MSKLELVKLDPKLSRFFQGWYYFFHHGAQILSELGTMGVDFHICLGGSFGTYNLSFNLTYI